MYCCVIGRSGRVHDLIGTSKRAFQGHQRRVISHIVSHPESPPNSGHLPLSSGDKWWDSPNACSGKPRLGIHACTGTQLADPLYAPLITSRGVALRSFLKLRSLFSSFFTSIYHPTSSQPQILFNQQSLSSPNSDNVRYYNGYSDHPV